MITGYFGVPGCGKSTFLAMLATKELLKIRKGKSKYKYVLTNFPVHGCKCVRLEDLGRFDIHDSLILFDEITLDADSRDFKTFPIATKISLLFTGIVIMILFIFAKIIVG